MKKRVLSGIRATGQLHLGNYFGAVKGMLELQETSDTFYMVADGHTLTTPYSAAELRVHRRSVIIDYLSCGLDPEKSVLFLQSLVPQHFELAFYFSSVMSVARMQHLPTFKDKVKQHPQNVTMALLNYPVLMAADILLYKATHVPVGIDQEPHIEVAREIARKMNELYGTTFPEPVRFATKGEYIPSLLGEGKMSKSVENSAIDLTDDLDTISKKLSKAPTDAGSGEAVPAKGSVANLLQLVELFESTQKRKKYELAYMSSGIRYGQLKQELAQAIFAHLEPIQKRRQELLADPAFVDSVIVEGAARARAVAEQTLVEVRTALGLGAIT